MIDNNTNIYENNTLIALDWSDLMTHFQQFSFSNRAKDYFEQLHSQSIHQKELETQFSELSEYAWMESMKIELPIIEIKNFEEQASRLQIQNYYLSESDFDYIRSLTKNTSEIQSIINQIEEKNHIIGLKTKVDELVIHKKIILEIDRCIDENQQIKSNASPKLQELKRAEAELNSKLQRSFEQALRATNQNGYLDDIKESIRNGRRVLAVLAENKRKVQGIIIDESESGSIVFIEPSDTVNLNNEFQEIHLDIAREKRKILIGLTATIAEYAQDIVSYENQMLFWDILQTKYKFMNWIGGSIPVIAKEWKLQNAFHPLLEIKNKQQKLKTIPFSMEMSSPHHALLISGPNAGGKTVTLKTLGLIALMTKFGLPIATHQVSEVPLYREILGDIGDGQSLNDELSTYSAKLKLWNYMTQKAGKNTFLLFDEMGNGTDPSFGASMAQAVFESCLQKGAFVVASTHFSELKSFGANRTDVRNASLLFDEVLMEPQFKLILDKPGSSYTFHIAQKLNLPQEIINRAKNLSNNQKLKIENQLLELEKKELELNQRDLDFKKAESELNQLIRKWERTNNELDLIRNKLKYEKMLLKSEIENEKTQELKKFKKTLESKSFKELKNEEIKIKETQKDQIQLAKEAYKNIHQKKNEQPLEVGDTVEYVLTHARGVIDNIKRDKAEVIFDNMRSNIPLKDLMRVESHAKTTLKTKKVLNSEKVYVKELDLRGKFPMEAIPMVEEFIDNALVNNIYEVRIIHGRGKLQKEVARVLHQFKNLNQVAHALPEHGGDGVTIVQL